LRFTQQSRASEKNRYKNPTRHFAAASALTIVDDNSEGYQLAKTGVSTSVRFSFAFFVVDQENLDLSVIHSSTWARSTRPDSHFIIGVRCENKQGAKGLGRGCRPAFVAN
jgi:hypothetical protein